MIGFESLVERIIPVNAEQQQVILLLLTLTDSKLEIRTINITSGMHVIFVLDSTYYCIVLNVLNKDGFDAYCTLIDTQVIDYY